MGFSVAAASCVIGISLLIIFEMFSGTIVPLFSDVNTAYEDMMHREAEKAHTHIEIMNATAATNETAYDLTIEVENNGGITISLAECNLLINGMISSFHTSNPVLFPKETAQLQVYNVTGSELMRLKLVTENGIETYYEYYI